MLVNTLIYRGEKIYIDVAKGSGVGRGRERGGGEEMKSEYKDKLKRVSIHTIA